jgi:hypothetical protein
MHSSRRFVSSCFALACAALLLALPALAQQGRWASSTPEQRAQKQTELMKEKLALTAEQVPKVEAINLDAAQKGQAIFSGKESRAEKLKQAHEIQQAKETALKEVLTADQFSKYQAARDELKEQMKQRVRERRSGTGGQ